MMGAQRNRKMKYTPLAEFALASHTAAVQLDQLSRNAKTQACALSYKYKIMQRT